MITLFERDFFSNRAERGSLTLLGEVELGDKSEERVEIAYPRAQSRPEDTAGIKQQRRTAWIFAIGILLLFLAVSSLLVR